MVKEEGGESSSNILGSEGARMGWGAAISSWGRGPVVVSLASDLCLFL